MKHKFYLLVLSCFLCANLDAQIVIGTLPYSYTQNFDGYNPNSAANFSSTIPAGWSGNSSGTPAYRGIGTGTNTAGGYWGYGTLAETSLGALRTNSTGNITYTVSFTNNTGSTITELTIGYDFEQWRYSNTSGFAVTQTNIGASVAGLSHNGTNSGTNGTVTVTPKSINLTGLNIANSVTFSISFQTTDVTGADNGIGIDNFSLSAVGAALPACTEPTAQATALSLVPASSSVDVSFTASPSANGYLVVRSTSSSLSGAPVDGTTYSLGDPIGTGTVVYNGTGTSFTDAGLTSSTTYYYFVFAYNSGGACQINYLQTSPLSGNTTTLAPPAATVLYPGDMVFVSYDNLANRVYNPAISGDDYLAFANLVPLTPGTKFLIANATYETGGKPAAGVRTNLWFTCTATPTGNVPFAEVTYTGTSNLPAGSIICFISPNEGSSAGATLIAKTSSGDNTNFTVNFKQANNIVGNSGLINISTSAPDALFLIQGSFTYNAAGSTFNGRVLGGIQDGGTWYGLSDDLSAISGNNLRISRKHPDIECFSIQGIGAPAIHSTIYDFSLTSGTQHQLLSHISNPANWIVPGSKVADYIDWGNLGFGDVNDPNCETNACGCPKDYLTVLSPALDGQWIGTANTNWFDCRNWDNLQVPTPSTNVIIPPTAFNDCVVDHTAPYAAEFSYTAECNNINITGRRLAVEKLNDLLVVNGNLQISGTGTLDMDDANPVTYDGTIQLHGNWTNNVSNAAFMQGNSLVEFVGTTNQTIDATDANETFSRMRLDNANGLTINQVTQFDDNFDFVNGKVTTAAGKYLEALLFNPGSITGHNDNRYVVGKLRRAVLNGQNYDFPVGTPTLYQLATVNFGAAVLGIPSLDASFSTTIGGTPPSINEGSWTYNTMADGGIWTIEPASGTFTGTYDITLNLKGSSNAENNCIVVKRPDMASAWTNSGTSGGCTNGLSLISSRTGLSSFSDFGIAVSNTPFPVEWLSFDATLLPNLQVQLDWKTAQEINNKSFIIQRSADGLHYENIGIVDGNGTVYQISEYQFFDEKPNIGRNFYRLEQVDINGNRQFSNVVEIFVADVREQVKIYPNPATDFLNIKIPQTKANLLIFDVSGREILRQEFENQIQVSTTDLSAGVYFYQIEFNNQTVHGKIVKE